MPDIIDLLQKWWKQISALVLLSLIAAGAWLYFQPHLYLSTATALPASAVANDRSRLFNQNIQSLYSDLGSPDDLDMIIGTARLDTVFLAVTDQFNLYDHYHYEGINKRAKAAKKLKKNCRVYKSDYGELKVKLWDTDKELAPQLANALVDVLQSIHSQARNAGNRSTLEWLETALKNNKDSAINSNKPELEKLLDQFRIMAAGKTPALVIIEKARPSEIADKPRAVETLAITFILSFLFAVLCAVLLERKKIKREGSI